MNDGHNVPHQRAAPLPAFSLAIRYCPFAIQKLSVICLVLLLSLSPSLRAATAAFHPQAAHRIDFQTFIVSPAGRPDWRQVTAFIGLSVRGAEGCAGVLLLPVDGVPENVSAQAVALAQFDAAYVHNQALEGAFLHRSLSERNAAAALWTTACLVAGPPAWLALSPHWPPRGRALTAVVPARSFTELPPHALQRARILIGDGGLEEAPIPLRPAVAEAMALSSSRCVIAVFFQPALLAERQYINPASSGIRVSFLVPVGRQGGAEALRMVMAGSLGPAPALTRIYVETGPRTVPELLFGEADPSELSPQRLVTRALEGFGYSEEYLRDSSRKSEATRLDTVRRPDGTLTARLIGLSTVWGEPPCVLFHRRALGRVGVLRAWAGTALQGMLWPFLAAVYLGLIWLSVRACRWLAGIPRARLTLRRFALLAALAPVVTPFFALRILLHNEQPANDHPGDGALAVLPQGEYQALARLMTWACFAAVCLLLTMLLLRLALWLSYG